MLNVGVMTVRQIALGCCSATSSQCHGACEVFFIAQLFRHGVFAEAANIDVQDFCCEPNSCHLVHAQACQKENIEGQYLPLYLSLQVYLKLHQMCHPGASLSAAQSLHVRACQFCARITVVGTCCPSRLHQPDQEKGGHLSTVNSSPLLRPSAHDLMSLRWMLLLWLMHATGPARNHSESNLNTVFGNNLLMFFNIAKNLI